IANASVNGSFNAESTAIAVGGGATLTLGSDQSGENTGTVNIGNSLGATATDGWIGIHCYSNCTVNDAALVGQSSVVIHGQYQYDIDAEDFSNITLTSKPILGVAPEAMGFAQCTNKQDFMGVYTFGPAAITFKNGIIQCMSGFGVRLDGDFEGTPTANIDN